MSQHRPTISIILPVFKEEGLISQTIGHLRAQPYEGGLEIIIVDGDPRGGTIRTISDRSVITATSEKGRGRQMNRGAELASGDVLLFLHADTLLPGKGLLLIESVMKKNTYPVGSFNLGINNSRAIFRVTEHYAAFRTRLTKIPFGDQAIFIRRSYFEEIGGYRNIPIMEDVDLMSRIKKRGDPVWIIPEKALTSPRRWERDGIIYCSFRNWMLQLLYCSGVSPDRLAKFYRS